MAGLNNSSPVYADSDDLVAYAGTISGVAEHLLVEASAHVRAATRHAVYSTDENDMPVDVDLLDAMHDATILQATALDAIGWVRGASLATEKPGIASKSLGGASVSYESGGGAAGAARRALLGGELCGAAQQILHDAGLISVQIQSAHAQSARSLARVRGLA